MKDKIEKWYIVYDFGYSDTDSAVIEFEGKPTESEVADILDIDERKIRLIEKKD